MTEGAPKSYESMDFSELESDPVAGPILQEVALRVLKTEDRDHFYMSFNGNVDSDGYLIQLDGLPSNTKPSQNMSGGPVMEKTWSETLAELKKRGL